MTALLAFEYGTRRRTRGQAACTTIDCRATIDPPAQHVLDVARDALHVANLAFEQAYFCSEIIHGKPPHAAEGRDCVGWHALLGSDG